MPNKSGDGMNKPHFFAGEREDMQGTPQQHESVQPRAANENIEGQHLQMVSENERPREQEEAPEGLTGAPADIARTIENAPANTVMFIGAFTGKAGSRQIVSTREDAKRYMPDLQKHFRPIKEGSKPEVVVVSAQELRERGVGENGEGGQEEMRKICSENPGKKILADLDPIAGIPPNAWTALREEFPSFGNARGAGAELELANWLKESAAAGKEPPAGQPSLKAMQEALPAGVHMWQQIRAKLDNRPLIEASPLDAFSLALLVFAEKKHLTADALAVFVDDPHRSKESIGFAYFGEQEKVRGGYGDSARKLG